MYAIGGLTVGGRTQAVAVSTIGSLTVGGRTEVLQHAIAPHASDRVLIELHFQSCGLE